MAEEPADNAHMSHAPSGLVREQAEEIKQRGNFCFGCGSANPDGLHLHFEHGSDAAGAITASCRITLTRRHEGPPGHVHGGVIATLLDEAMSKLNRPLDLLAMTRSLNIDYLRPAPLETPLKVIGTHLRREGRKLFHAADLMLEDGTLLAHGEGLFLVIPAEMLLRARAL